jgi:hypothetical protein
MSYTEPAPPRITVTMDPFRGICMVSDPWNKWPETETLELQKRLERQYLGCQTDKSTLDCIQAEVDQWIDNLIHTRKIRYDIFETGWSA